jgi:hypothetical protein
MAAAQFWVAREDLPAAMRELSELLSLGLSAAYVDGLGGRMDETWYGGELRDGKIIPGPWISVAHHADPDLHVEVAQDECGGAILRINCDEPGITRIRATLTKYNPSLKSVIFKSISD